MHGASVPGYECRQKREDLVTLYWPDETFQIESDPYETNLSQLIKIKFQLYDIQNKQNQKDYYKDDQNQID